MKLKKPKSCRGCWWYMADTGTTGHCLYRSKFPTKEVKHVLWRRFSVCEDIFVNIGPEGKCPKPLTRSEAVYWMKEFEKNKGAYFNW